MNKKYISLVFVFLTIILGIVAIFTAWRLQQLRSTAPDKSQAADVVDSCEVTTFTITRQETPTPTPTESPTASPTSSPTGSPTSSPTASPTSSPTDSPTVSPTSTPTGTSTPVASSTATPLSTPVPTPELPNSGIGLPVIAGIALSTLFILAAVILVL